MSSQAQPAPASRPVCAVPPGPQRLLSLPGTLVQYERDAEILAQDSVVHHCMEVVAGCVRTVSLLEDGRRQVGEFLFPGDILDWNGMDLAPFGAEAVTAVTLRRVAHAAIDERANRDAAFAQRLRRHAMNQACAARARCILLGRKTALERIASFLREMDSRLAQGGRQSGFEIPMSRTDIADYLGLTPETVCRTLAELRQLELVRVERSRVTILNQAGLAQVSSDRWH